MLFDHPLTPPRDETNALPFKNFVGKLKRHFQPKLPDFAGQILALDKDDSIGGRERSHGYNRLTTLS